MVCPANTKPHVPLPLDLLDRLAIAYLTLPLAIFLVSWLEAWAAVPLIACMAYALKPLLARRPIGGAHLPITPMHFIVAALVGCGWTVLGGTDHLVYANADWHIRDAVLHDLVVSSWPVGYGPLDGQQSLLRTPLAYYLPAALVGKWAGLPVGHLAMAVWTAVGATLFLLQVLSLMPFRAGVIAMAVAVVIFFSGFDVIGILLDVPRFFVHWDIARHLEWWAGDYQYSSMTTQLFWVPNHALGGWLTIGLLCRDQRGTPLNLMLPIVVVAVVLWSPLTALGIIPFVLWKTVASMVSERSWSLLDPCVWAPALVVGIVVTGYLTLDSGRIHKAWGVGAGGVADMTMGLLRQAQFFLLEAGLTGIAILAIRRSSQVVLALVILGLLPLLSFGPANDLVMRTSIPSLTVLAIGACLALSSDALKVGALRKKMVLGCMLVVGAVTPFQEFARAAVLPSWPINMQATLIGAACGKYPEHYVARLGDQVFGRLLRRPHPLPVGPQGRQSCDNPAVDLMWERELRDSLRGSGNDGR